MQSILTPPLFDAEWASQQSTLFPLEPRFRAPCFPDTKYMGSKQAVLPFIMRYIQQLDGSLKRSLALASACRAAMKKRPRGIFTFTGRKGWDERKDLKLSMREQFLDAAAKFNAAVFSNRRRNRALCQDVFSIDPAGYDLVYIDPPYISPYSDCDYTCRYHFVYAYCTYW